MKLFKRLGILVSAMALFVTGFIVTGFIVAPVHSVQAQGTGTAPCFGLKADDCTLLQAAEKPAKGSLSSFTMDYDVTFKTTGMRNDVDFAVKGNGPFEFDLANLNPQGIITDPTSIAKIFDTLTIGNTLTASLKTATEDQSGNFEFRIVAGVLYFKGDKATNDQWMSLDLRKLATSSAFRRGVGGGRGIKGNATDIIAMVRDGIVIRKLINTPGFITLARTADTTIDTQTIATFVYTFNLSTLFSSPDLPTLIRLVTSQVGQGNSTAPKLTDAQITQIGTQLATAFKNTTVTYTKLVGTTDKLPHGVGFDIASTVNPQDFQGIMMSMGRTGTVATPEATASAAPMQLNFHFLVSLSKIGQKATLTAPANATPVNLGAGLGGGLSGTPEPSATMAATSSAQ